MQRHLNINNTIAFSLIWKGLEEKCTDQFSILVCCLDEVRMCLGATKIYIVIKYAATS